MPVGSDGAFHYTSYSGYKGSMHSEWKHEAAEEKGKKESKYHGLRLYQVPGQSDAWSAVLYPPPGQVGRVERHFEWSSLRSPLIILHKLPGEVEAALAKDLLDLWYGLSQGWSQEQLAAHEWNLPQMKLWAEPKLVQTLGSIGPEEYKKAQTRVRGLVSKWLPQVPKEVIQEGEKAATARRDAEKALMRHLSELARGAQAEGKPRTEQVSKIAAEPPVAAASAEGGHKTRAASVECRRITRAASAQAGHNKRARTGEAPPAGTPRPKRKPARYAD